MYTQYGDNILAQLVVDERLMLRERINFNMERNSIMMLKSGLILFVNAVAKKLEEPTVLPVYCFEYAPDC